MDLVSATDIIFLFRIRGEETIAWKPAFQTDTSTDESRTYETTETKDGAKKTPGAYEGTHSLTTLVGQGDTLIAKIKDQVRKQNPEGIEVWEIDRSGINDETQTTIPGEYSLDVVTSYGTSAGAEGNVELTIETEVAEGIVSGEVEVTPELLAILKRISDELEFKQPTAVDPAGA